MMKHDLRFLIGDTLYQFVAISSQRVLLREAIFYHTLANAYKVPGYAAVGLAQAGTLTITPGDTAKQQAAENVALAAASFDPDSRLLLTWWPLAQRFATVASHIIAAPTCPELNAWPEPENEAGVRAAFEFLLDHDELFMKLETLVKELAMPNGLAGAAPEQLTPAQRADPLP